jgi:hypothetical protein
MTASENLSLSLALSPHLPPLTPLNFTMRITAYYQHNTCCIEGWTVRSTCSFFCNKLHVLWKLVHDLIPCSTDHDPFPSPNPLSNLAPYPANRRPKFKTRKR